LTAAKATRASSAPLSKIKSDTPTILRLGGPKNIAYMDSIAAEDGCIPAQCPV